MERRYSVPPTPTASIPGAPASVGDNHHSIGSRPHMGFGPSASEDLHAWSIYRQNLNSDFTDSALGSSEKSPLPYGNFQLRESTVQSILSHPRYGPKSALGSNMYTYLKFGLPRVFPPSRGPRDGSSGYDSSDDGSPHLHRQGRNYLRSRSDPDFRSQPLHRPYPGHGPRMSITQHPNMAARIAGGWTKAKSSSEANLLSHDMYGRHHEHRRSVHDLRPPAFIDADPQMLAASHLSAESRRRISKANSHASLGTNHRGPSIPNGIREEIMMNGRLHDTGGMIPREAYYTGLPEHGDLGTPYKHPHLQVRGLEVDSKSSKHMLLLQGISFDVRGGEIMAVMATSEDEGTGLLDALSGRSSHIGKIRGDILLNGQSVRSIQLRDRVAYVQSDSHLSADLSVRQTLGFHHWMRRSGSDSSTPSTMKVPSSDKINALIEDLGLDQVRHTKVASLTTSERRRLNVACHLVLDTDIVVLDQPTRGMDIFDTFFLVEFLRQWASNNAGIPTGTTGGRIVILTLHPPTYEIFTMLSRVVLISAGRLMYSGRRRDMLPYFATIEYPCPAYKNPSDYYLDLVTLDDLSAEAMLESSQRIEQLTDTFRRRQEPLSDPGLPAALPLKIHQSNLFVQMFALLIRALVYAQPVSLTRWLSHLLLAVAISLIVGAIFWDIPSSDPHLVLGDRLGFHYTMAMIAPWPLWLQLSIAEVGRERWSVDRDVRDRLYCKSAYIFTKILYNLPASACVWIGYLIPAYSMSGLHVQGIDSQAFYIYGGYMLLYLLALQMAFTFAAYALKYHHISGLLIGLFIMCLALVSGFPVHLMDLGAWSKWLGMASPAKWLLPVLVRREYSSMAISSSTASIMCRNKQVQHQDIIVQLPCPPPNGTAALQYVNLLPDRREPDYVPPLAVGVFWFLCFLLAAGSYLASCYRPRQSRNNPNKP